MVYEANAILILPYLIDQVKWFESTVKECPASEGNFYLFYSFLWHTHDTFQENDNFCEDLILFDTIEAAMEHIHVILLIQKNENSISL